MKKQRHFTPAATKTEVTFTQCTMNGTELSKREREFRSYTFQLDLSGAVPTVRQSQLSRYAVFEKKFNESLSAGDTWTKTTSTIEVTEIKDY